MPTYACIHTSVHGRTHICIHAYIHYAYIHTPTNTHTHAHAHAYTHVHTYVHTCIHARVLMHVSHTHGRTDMHHHHWTAVVSRGWVKALAYRLQVSILCCPLSDRVAPVYRLQVSMSCAVLCQIVSLQYTVSKSVCLVLSSVRSCRSSIPSPSQSVLCCPLSDRVAPVYRLQVSLSCAVLCQIVSLQYTVSKLVCLVLSSVRSVAPVFDQVVSHSLAGLPCRLFLS